MIISVLDMQIGQFIIFDSVKIDFGNFVHVQKQVSTINVGTNQVKSENINFEVS
jgi:hypothetical protein